MTDLEAVSQDVPVCPKRPHVHEVRGVRRSDDFAWLRDADDPQTRTYLAAERAHYDRVTDRLGALRETLTGEQVARTPAREESVRWREAGADWLLRIEADDEHHRLVRIEPSTGAEHIALDLNQLAGRDGYADVGLRVPSPDGRLLAYTVDRSGDEVFELRFLDLTTGQHLPDVVERVYYGGAWSSDSGTFFYTVHDAMYRPDRVHRHRLGQDPARDPVVLTEPDERFALDLHGSLDGDWVVITSESRDTSEVHLVSTHAPQQSPRLVAGRRTGVEYRVEPLRGGWDGAGPAGQDELLLVTNDGRAEFDLRLAPVPGPAAVGRATSWRALPWATAQDGERLESAVVLARHVVVSLRRDGEPLLRVLSRRTDGPVTAGPTPTGREVAPSVPYGQVGLWNLRDANADEVTIVEESLVNPPTWFALELDTGQRRLLRRTAVPGVQLDRYVSERLWATAPDGTAVPVTIARRVDVVAGQSAGALLYGYGAYEACSWPDFAVGTLSLLDRGVVFAVAHVRGGGELGRHWWTQGRLRHKQHTFDDFIAARDALVAAGLAPPDGVVSRGLSAGGLLQAAVFSQAPERWRAVVAEVPFVDVVTTMCDPSVPLTVTEWDEWGDPLHDPEDLAAMLAYSPYDNPPPPGRPALLVTGALFDPRVLVHEPAKWVARLRDTDDPADPSPLLLRVELGEGAHTGPSGRFDHLGYEAEVLAWVLDQLGRGSA